jgi:hypothetical protein
VLQGAFQPAADKPRIEGIVTVLHENRALRETQKRSARILELGCADEH